MATTLGSSITYIIYSPDAGQRSFIIPFPYLDASHVRIAINNNELIQGTQYSVREQEGDVYLASSITVASTDVVKVFRKTEREEQLYVFENGSVITEQNLNNSFLQCLYIAQENSDLFNTGGSVSIPGSGSTPDVVVDVPIDFDPVDGVVDTGVDLRNRLFFLFVNGVKLPQELYTIVNNTQIEISREACLKSGDTVELAFITGGTVTSIDVGAVDSAGIQDGAVTNAKLANGSVTWNKLASSTFNTSDWGGSIGSVAGSSGPQNQLYNLHTRLAALEASTVANPALNVQAIDSSAIPASTTTATASFTFSPTFVMICHGKGVNGGSNNEKSCGFTFIVRQGDTGRNYVGTVGNDSDNNRLFFNNVSLSGNTLTYSFYGTGTIDGGTCTFVAYKTS